MNNPALFQFFHWYYPDDGNLWNHCKEQAAGLAALGITHTWLPPAYKSAKGSGEPGYAVYDLYDLGEFDQQGTVRTKYGTKEQYLACISALHEHQLQVIADMVLNHMHGADEKEKMLAREVNAANRNEMAEQATEIEAHTKFNFPGRGDRYSNYAWNKDSFTGVSELMDDHLKIFLIDHEHTNDHWDEMLDDEMGNFDYLMGADIDFRNQFVREELKRWGKWYVETTGIDGFRLDAVKHINFRFFKEWLLYLKETFKRDFFCIAEYWSGKTASIINYCKALDLQCLMYDVPLHFNFFNAAQQKNNYDLRKIFDGSVLQQLPQNSLTFVDNHDSQPFQALESYVDYWFQPLAYAIILLREQGFPCIFYPALYGAKYEDQKGAEKIQIDLAPVPALDNMMRVRAQLAYGEQYDYFDHPNTVGWVRKGIAEKEHSGCAVVLCNGSDGDKAMDMGAGHAGQAFIDITGNRPDKITTDDQGKGVFPARGGTVSVWVREAAAGLL